MGNRRTSRRLTAQLVAAAHEAAARLAFVGRPAIPPDPLRACRTIPRVTRPPRVASRPAGRLAAALLSAVLLLAHPAAAACAPDAVDIRGPFGQARFNVELADTPDERAKGLMFREAMPRASGMLFLYPVPQRAQFWMKNTLIPLDMVFIDAAGRVARVHPDARPQDLTPIDGGEGVAAVLEINGGLAARLGLAAGDELRHPAFDGPAAAWPCAR